jgi:dihydrofolate reductase
MDVRRRQHKARPSGATTSPVAHDRAFGCVAAADAAGGIGKDNDLPWPRLADDLAFLRRITSDAPAGKINAVVMGRLTWESVPSGKQPLPGRLNVVVSRRGTALPAGVLLAGSLDDALAQAWSRPDVAGVFVIGGAQIFAAAFAHPACRFVYLTRIDARFDCDAFLPPLAPRFALAGVLARHREHDIDYQIQRWDAGA